MKLARRQLILYYPHYHPTHYGHYHSHWHHYHYHDYYPFYFYYWYFFPEFHWHYAPYYSFYFFYWPHYHYYWHHHHYYHPIVVTSGTEVTIKDDESKDTALATLKTNKYKLKLCKNGPKHYFTYQFHGHYYRFFIGDVNDFFHLECLYLMDSVVTVGGFDHVDRIVSIYKRPQRNSDKKLIKKLNSPFKNSKLKPKNPKKTKINRNLSKLSFRLSSKGKKSLLFYHLYHKDIKNQKVNIFKRLSRKLKKKKSNILYIADHLQNSSLNELRRILRKFGKFSNSKIKNLKKLKKKKIFQ